MQVVIATSGFLFTMNKSRIEVELYDFSPSSQVSHFPGGGLAPLGGSGGAIPPRPPELAPDIEKHKKCFLAIIIDL